MRALAGDEQPSGCEVGVAWGLDEGGQEGSAGKRPAGDRGEARSSVPNEWHPPPTPSPATLSRLNGGAVEARPSGDTLSLPAIGGHAAVDAPPGGALSSGSPGLRAPAARPPAPSLPRSPRAGLGPARGLPGPSPAW